MNRKLTTASLLTPAGRGAIAVVVVDGEKAVRIVDAHFQAKSNRTLADSPIGRVLFGNWLPNTNQVDHGVAGEELVVCQVKRNIVEINCHGGVAAPSAILAKLKTSGCEVVDGSDTNLGLECPIARAAAIALTKATTRRTAEILLDQLQGSLRTEIETITQGIDDIYFAKTRLQRLLDFANLGLHLTKPWKIVIAGPPNVGKSSLINVLLGFERAIVYDQPGTTRDVVTATTSFNGWPVELSDTAGIRNTADPVELEGVKLAKREIADADLVVHMTDARDDAKATFAGAKPSTLISVRNKADLLRETPKHSDDCVYISAIKRSGIDDLISRILHVVVGDEPQRWQPVLFEEGQIAVVESSISQLENNDSTTAQAQLRRLIYE